MSRPGHVGTEERLSPPRSGRTADADRDGEVSWHRDEAGLAQRTVLTVAGDGSRHDARGRIRRRVRELGNLSVRRPRAR